MEWKLFLFSKIVSDSLVDCGKHTAMKCEDCPRGNGEWWCNGQCRWDARGSKCIKNGITFLKKF